MLQRRTVGNHGATNSIIRRSHEAFSFVKRMRARPTAHASADLDESTVSAGAAAAATAAAAAQAVASSAVLDDSTVSLSASQRHALIGNSFCVPVVEQLLQPLAALGAAVTVAGVAAAVDGLRLRAAGSAAARRWCSECESAACVFAH